MKLPKIVLVIILSNAMAGKKVYLLSYGSKAIDQLDYMIFLSVVLI